MPKVTRRKSLRQKQKQCQRQNVKQTVKINLVAAARARARRRNIRRGGGAGGPPGGGPPGPYPPILPPRPPPPQYGGGPPPPPPPPPNVPRQLPILVGPLNVPPLNVPPLNVPPINVPPLNVPPLNVPPLNVPPLFELNPNYGRDQAIRAYLERFPPVPRPPPPAPVGDAIDPLPAANIREAAVDAYFRRFPRVVPPAREARPVAPVGDAIDVLAQYQAVGGQYPAQAPAVDIAGFAQPEGDDGDPEMERGIFAGLPPRAAYRRNRREPIPGPVQAEQPIAAPYEWQTNRLREQYDAAETIPEQNDVVKLDRQIRNQRADARRYEQDLLRARITEAQVAERANEDALLLRRQQRMDARQPEAALAEFRANQALLDTANAVVDLNLNDADFYQQQQQAEAKQQEAKVEVEQKAEAKQRLSFDQITANQRARLVKRGAGEFELAEFDQNAQAEKLKRTLNVKYNPDSVKIRTARRHLKDALEEGDEDAEQEARQQIAQYEQIAQTAAPRLTRSQTGAGAGAGPAPPLPMSIFAYRLPPNVTRRTPEKKKSRSFEPGMQQALLESAQSEVYTDLFGNDQPAERADLNVAPQRLDNWDLEPYNRGPEDEE